MRTTLVPAMDWYDLTTTEGEDTIAGKMYCRSVCV